MTRKLVQQYAHARQAYAAARERAGGSAEAPEVLDASEQYRAALAAYILDLEVNGMSVPSGLEDEMRLLDQGLPGADDPS